MKRKVLIVCLLVPAMMLSLTLTGCPPHTSKYKPVSDWEQKEFDKANRDIYPNDVRQDLARYQDIAVAWTGIISESSITEHKDNFELKLLVEHHYYDWLEDYSIQREVFFLSPRGEGLFTTSWFLRKEANMPSIKEYAASGNMLIVYGKPEKIEASLIFLDASYVRPILRQWYTTKRLDYGRRGEPGRLLP